MEYNSIHPQPNREREMKTAEQILEEVNLHFLHDARKQAAIKAMQLYSDQQNKELMEKYKSVMALAQREQQQRIESDSEFFKAQEEIQRLTKEVEEYRVVNHKLESDLAKANLSQINQREELTRLRELLEKATEPAKILLKLVKDWDLLIDNKKDVDEFRVIAEIKRAEKLLTEIDNALKEAYATE